MCVLIIMVLLQGAPVVQVEVERPTCAAVKALREGMVVFHPDNAAVVTLVEQRGE